MSGPNGGPKPGAGGRRAMAKCACVCVCLCVCVSVGFWVLTGGRRNHRHRIVVYGYKL